MLGKMMKLASELIFGLSTVYFFYFIGEGNTVHPAVHEKLTLTVSIWCRNISVVTEMLQPKCQLFFAVN